MAQVTFGLPSPARHVVGDLSCHFYVVSGATGSTFSAPGTVLFIANQPFTQAGTASLITGISVAAGVITLTSSAPMVNEVIEVLSRP